MRTWYGNRAKRLIKPSSECIRLNLIPMTFPQCRMSKTDAAQSDGQRNAKTNPMIEKNWGPQP
jgi:hypothetical protein